MSLSLFDISGQVAIITGGNGGIGLGIAKGLAAAGATVVLAARNAAKAEKAIAEIAAQGGRAIFKEVDVGNRDACFRVVNEIVDELGHIEILVANSGIGIPGLPQDLTEEDWNQVLNVNLGGAFFMAQAVYPFMKAGGKGKIVTMGSLASTFGSSSAPYSSSKGALLQLTRALAVAWATDNIQVNCILSGWIETDIVEQIKAVPGLEDRVIARTPAKRWGQPADMAGTGIFLCSSASDFVTGAALAVDGGYSVALT